MIRCVLFLALILLGAGSSFGAQQVSCKSERMALFNAMKIVARLDASLNEKEDADPLTLEYFFVKELPADQAHVSDDGQVIYLPSGEKNSTTRVKLLAIALDRRLAIKLGDGVCPPLPAPGAGR